MKCLKEICVVFLVISVVLVDLAKCDDCSRSSEERGTSSESGECGGGRGREIERPCHSGRFKYKCGRHGRCIYNSRRGKYCKCKRCYTGRKCQTNTCARGY